MGGRRTSEEVRQAVREGISLGMSYQEISHITGVSSNLIAKEKRAMGLKLGPGPFPAPQTHVSQDVLAAVSAALEMGMSNAEISRQFRVSNETIADVGRQTGIIRPKSTATRAGKARRQRDLQLAKAINSTLPRLPEDFWEGTATELLAVMGSQPDGVPRHVIGLSTVLGKAHVINALSQDYGITVHRTIVGGRRLIQLRYTPQAPIPAPTPAPTQVQEQQPQEQQPSYNPESFFEAIKAGILEGHAREETLEADIKLSKSRIVDLESKARELRDELLQVRAQKSSWAGPMPLPKRNLSSGG